MSSVHRRRRVAARGDEREPAWLSAAWGLLVKPTMIGALLSISGALLVLAPWLKAPGRRSSAWWVGGLEDAALLMMVSVLSAIALGLMVGVAWQGRLARRGEAPLWVDLTWSQTPEPEQTPGLRAPWAGPAGVALMVLGVLLGVGCWLSLQGDVLPTQAAISVGQPTEFVRARVSDQPLRLMLPRRVQISDIRMAPPQSVTLTLALPKQQDVSPQTLLANESVEVGGKRLTFVGVIQDPQQLRVVLSGKGEQSIEATGRVGDKVRVTLDGPAFEIKEITRNYLGAMGPAVRLDSEQTGAFWLFERPTNERLGSPFDEGLRLVRLETLPAAVFTVGPPVPFEPLVVALVCVLLGTGLLFGAPQLSVLGRGRRQGISLAEAGRWAESFAADPGASPRDESSQASAPSAEARAALQQEEEE